MLEEGEEGEEEEGGSEHMSGIICVYFIQHSVLHISVGTQPCPIRAIYVIARFQMFDQFVNHLTGLQTGYLDLKPIRCTLQDFMLVLALLVSLASETQLTPTRISIRCTGVSWTVACKTTLLVSACFCK